MLYFSVCQSCESITDVEYNWRDIIITKEFSDFEQCDICGHFRPTSQSYFGNAEIVDRDEDTISYRLLGKPQRY
tara:strand:+ start:297 stop:518 length:222 start_codon:yes stop_codon:yes gene_type:complete